MDAEKDIRDCLFDFLMQEAPILYLLFNNEGTIEDFNQYAEDLLGGGLRGKGLADVFVDFDGNLEPKDMATHAEQPILLHVSIPGDCPQTVLCTLKPLGDKYILLARFDPSELFQLQKELLAINNEINNLTRSLQKQKVELEKLNQLKNQFLGMAAHDLRKPTGLIMSYSEFLIDEVSSGLDQEHQEFLSIIRSTSETMKRMIDDFLDISLIESGLFELDIQALPVADLFRTTMPLLNQIARKKNIAIELSLEDGIPIIYLDPAKIEQIIINLVSNAIEYSQEGSHVLIGVYSNGSQVTFRVEDHGVGIPPDEIGKIFSPFGKGMTKKTSGEKSVGLGLAIAQQIVKQHNGTISVQSEVGKGSVFQFTIPFCMA